MSEEIKISDGAKDCAMLELDRSVHPAHPDYKPVGFHVERYAQERVAEQRLKECDIFEALQSKLTAAEQRVNFLEHELNNFRQREQLLCQERSELRSILAKKDEALTELCEFLLRHTVEIQRHREMKPDHLDRLFQECYRLYTKYDVEFKRPHLYPAALQPKETK